MKKTVYGFLLFSIVGVVSCDKESLEQNTEATTGVRENLEKANAKYYAIGAETLNQQLLRKEYNINTFSFGSGTTLNNYLYYGIGAYNYDTAVLEQTGTNSSTLYYESGIPGNNKYGPIKFNGTDFLMDEVELIDDDITKIYGLRGRNVYKLTYNPSTTNFDATIIYTYPGKPIELATRRFTIAPVVDNNNSIRLYSANSVGSQQGQPPAMTTLSYLDIDTTFLFPPSQPVSVATLIPGGGNLSSFTAKDYFNPTPAALKYYVVVDKDIYNLNTSTTLALTSSFANSVRDCSFYNR